MVKIKKKIIKKMTTCVYLLNPWHELFETIIFLKNLKLNFYSIKC